MGKKKKSIFNVRKKQKKKLFSYLLSEVLYSFHAKKLTFAIFLF